MLTDKLMIILFGLIFLLMIACSDSSEPVNQQTAAIAPPLKENRSKAAFLDYAASTNMLQIELARLAMERGQSEEVRKIGKQALEFHAGALDSLRLALGAADYGSLPDSLGAADRAIVEEFRNVPAAEFDARYRQYLISAHTAQLERYQEVLLKTEEETIRNWIRQVQEQLRERVQVTAKADTVSL